MWVVAKVKKTELEIFKKDLIKKASADIKFYCPKIEHNKHFKNNIKKNGIQIIYTIGPPKIEDFQIYMNDICFIKRKINKITSIHELKKC